MLVVSDVISARLNDGENIKGSLQDSPNRPDFLQLSHNRTKARWWGNLWYKDASETHPDTPGLSVVRSTRAILADMKGTITLGKYEEKPSFLGT